MDRIEAATDRLRLFPQLGRPSKRPRTRELAVPGTPFVLIYRWENDVLEIIALYHGAQDWQENL
jgi:plasmid stabilization system protein ParE